MPKHSRRDFIRRIGSVASTALMAPVIGACGGSSGEGGSAQGSGSAAGQSSGDSNNSIAIEPAGNQMKFAQTEIRATAGTEFTLGFENTATSPAMHHNVVVLKPIEGVKKTVGTAAMTAKQNDYIPPKHTDKIIAHTPMSAPGETVEVTFTVPEPGEYPYICTYPGHWQTMQGILYSERA